MKYEHDRDFRDLAFERIQKRWNINELSRYIKRHPRVLTKVGEKKIAGLVAFAQIEYYKIIGRSVYSGVEITLKKSGFGICAYVIPPMNGVNSKKIIDTIKNLET